MQHSHSGVCLFMQSFVITVISCDSQIPSPVWQNVVVWPQQSMRSYNFFHVVSIVHTLTGQKLAPWV